MFPKVATKCIRVSSTATNKAVIETLIEKFRPDMKMLEVNIQFVLFKHFFVLTSLKPTFQTFHILVCPGT